MNVVLLLAHSIEQYDQTKLLTELGYDVFGFNDPTQPFDDKRPALPNAPVHQDLLDACWRTRDRYAHSDVTTVHTLEGWRDPVDWAKADLPEEVIEWGDVFIVHHLEHTWLAPVQWDRLKQAGKRVIWRTVGQSVENNERLMAPLRRGGLEIVRYSPKEEHIPGYIGRDALVRFYADPDEWGGWTGITPWVFNVTQHDSRPHGRDRFVNWAFWEAATEGLNRAFAGPHSELIGGMGTLPYEEMKAHLRAARCYVYTGTQPASYTLGLIEALMTGVPVVSIGPNHMGIYPNGPAMFEGHEIALSWSNDPVAVQGAVAALIAHPERAEAYSKIQRTKAIELFGRATIAAQWRDYLGAP